MALQTRPQRMLAVGALLFGIVIGPRSVAGDPGPSVASPIHPEHLAAASRPSLASPLRFAPDLRLHDAVWADEGLWPTRPARLRGLAQVLKPGTPTYDPTSRGWYASANGVLVRVESDGTLPVLCANVQGIDVDVRVGVGLAVSREPDFTIVLHRMVAAGCERKVLLTSPGFFAPRLSPDGNRILVSESRAGGGHMWIVSPDGASRDLGQGYTPAWHPDGKRIVFARVVHDGLLITAAELWALELAGGAESQLTHTPSIAEMNPVVSPDGKWVAYSDGRTGEAYVAAMPRGGGGS